MRKTAVRPIRIQIVRVQFLSEVNICSTIRCLVNKNSFDTISNNFILCDFSLPSISLLPHIWITTSFPYYHRNAGLDDAGLLPCDFLQRVAQILHVVIADIGYDACHRGYDVGGIQPATKPALDHRNIHLAEGEPAESHGGSNLKERCVKFLKQRLIAAEEAIHPLLLHHLPVDLNPLPEIHQMRGSVQAHPEATWELHEGRGYHVADGALAVGAGNVNRAEIPGRIAQRLIKLQHILKAGLVCPVPYHLERRKPLIDFLQHPVVFCIGEHKATKSSTSEFTKSIPHICWWLRSGGF